MAIAVDNLANAHVLTKDEENERLEREAKNEQPQAETERKISHWQEIGNATKTLKVVNSWPSHSNPSTDESNCGANGENSTNG